MRLAISAQERPARNALTVAVTCVNRTRKHAASAIAYSVLRACPSIRSTRSLHQQTTRRVENERLHEGRTPLRWVSKLFQNAFPLIPVRLHSLYII